MSLLHVTTRAAWEAATDALRPPSLDAAGFVHLCTEAQLEGVLARFFEGATDLVILHVDEARLPDGALRWERVDDADGEFPHLYAPLPRAAVEHVSDDAAR